MVQAPSGPEKPSLPQTLNFAHAHSPYSSSGVTIISDTLGANEHILTAIGSSSEPISFRTADVSFTSSLANRNLNQLAFHRALSETISSYVTPTPFTAVHEVPLSSLITNTMTEASTFFLTYPWINSPGKQTTVSLPNTKPNSSIKYRRTLIRHPPLSVEKSLQHLYRPRMFLASNNDGILVFTRTRPIEHLSQLISTASRDSSAFMSQSSAIPELPNPIISFIDSFKPAEVCSMCLFLSSSSEPLTALSSSSDDSFFVPLFSKQGTVVQQSQTVQQTQQVEKKSKTRTTHGTPLFSSTLRDGSCNSLLITPLKSLNTPLPDRTPRNFDTPSRSSNRNMAVKLTPFSGGGSYPFGSPTFSPSQDSAIIRTTSYHSNSPLQICEIIAKKYSDSLSHFIPILTTSMTRVFVADPTTNSFPSLSSLYHSNIQLQAVQACSDKPLTSLHNGLVLFLARFLAPLWNTTIIKLTVLSNDQDPSKNKTSEKKTDKPWYHPRRILDLFTFLPSYEDLPEMDADLPETNPQQPPESSVQKLKRPQSGTVPLNQQRTVKFPSEAAPISSLQTPARSNAPLGYLTPPPNATMHQDLNPHADRLFQSLQTPSRFYPQNTVRPALPTTTTKTSDRKLIPTDLEYPFVYLGAFLRSSTQKTQTRLLDEGVSHVTSCAASLALHPSVILPFARTLSSFLKALSNCPSLLPSSPQLPSQAYQFLNTISSDPSGSLVRSVADVDNQISQLEESDFLQSLLAILTRSYEFLLFLLLLSDVGCPCVSSKEKDSPFIIFIRQAKKLPESTVSLTFKDLISSSLGSFVVSALIETATSHTSSENATLARMLDTSEKVSTAFHTFAPSFHTQHDTNVNKARSILKTVGEAVTSKTLSESERVNNETLLVSARDLLIQSIAHVSLDEFCPLFQALNKPGYCVSLAIAKAQNEDPTNAALAWVKGGRSTEDRIGTDRFNSRNVCYRWVVQTLEWESKYISYQYSRPIQYNQTPHPTGGLITPPTSSETILKCETFNIALQSDDVLLQYAVFGWMLTQPHLRPVLLNLNSPHLTTFLSSNTSNTGQQAEGAGDIDVLWEHYIRMNSLHKAATELRKLAKDPELVLERSNHRANHQNLLSLRIYYLTLASGCLSDPSATTGPTHSEKQILQLQIDVAKLQLDIRNEIVSKKDAISLQQPQPGQSREEEVKRCQEALLALDRQLYDATTLFKTFIVPFNLRSSTQKVSELLERYGDSPMSSFSS
ncbi:putative nuclear pore complex protein Nup155 [Blattamonas nauphoetae]|uniref:Nuclear pore complex protein Nup155 n=1 Tax=Blattamonas nauphoetae TaxID=2049346 RepID=A0ABQ9YL94_9EUKA|nr:putative nuclear pore complex protein Nup155 [Blattamonas nauphoetae]